MDPKISVIMPVYNASKYLREAIDSVLNQTFTNFELIILNDCSTDDSVEIIKSYNDNRIVFLDQEKNLGPALLRSKGIDNAKGNYIALLDADDIAMPTRFEKQSKILDENEAIGVCGTWYTIFGDDLEDNLIQTPVEPNLLRVEFLNNCHIGNSTIMLKKEVLKNLRFNPEYVPVEDYELWSRLIGITNFYNYPENLVRYRWHQTNITQTKKANTETALKKIKTAQLNLLSINPEELGYEAFVCATDLKKKIDSGLAINTIKAAKEILDKNKIHLIYDQNLLSDFLERRLIRTIRNANNYNRNFYKDLNQQTWIVKKMPLIDKIIIFFKCHL